MRIAFGDCVLWAALAAAGLYLFQLGARKLDAWMKRAPQPTDRVLAFIVLSSTLGAVAGAVLQPLVDDFRAGRSPFDLAPAAAQDQRDGAK